MSYKVGQSLLGSINFTDGETPAYNRPYLIVKVSDKSVGILNVSSTKGKEHKLLFPKNYSLKCFNPPFKKESFIKLDSYTEISITEANRMIKLSGGELLNDVDLEFILDNFDKK